MADIVFAQTRTHYYLCDGNPCPQGDHSHSYTDYWDLVRVSGFEKCYIDEIRLDRDAIYIIAPINGEVRPHLFNERKRVGDGKKSKIVWWSLERPQNAQENMNAHAVEIVEHVDEVWVSDRYFKRLFNHPAVHFIAMGSDERLAPGWLPQQEKSFDVIHLGAPSYHRYGVIGHIESDPKIRVAGNCWGELRHKNLLATKFMVNVHQTPVPMGEPLRFALAAAYRMPLISDRLEDSFPMEHGVDFINVDPAQIHAKVGELMQAPYGPMQAMGHNLFEKFCVQYQFEKQVRRAAVGDFDG